MGKKTLRSKCSGTLGSLVQDANGQYILSKNHVLGCVNQAVPGEDVNQPGMIDQNCAQVGAVADVNRLVPIQFKKKRNIPLNEVDAATAQAKARLLSDGFQLRDSDGLCLGYTAHHN